MSSSHARGAVLRRSGWPRRERRERDAARGSERHQVSQPQAALRVRARGAPAATARGRPPRDAAHTWRVTILLLKCKQTYTHRVTAIHHHRLRWVLLYGSCTVQSYTLLLLAVVQASARAPRASRPVVARCMLQDRFGFNRRHDHRKASTTLMSVLKPPTERCQLRPASACSC